MAIIIKVIKWMSLSLLGLIFLAVLGLEGFYHYKIYQLQPQQVHAQNQHSLMAKRALWIEANEVGDIGLEKLSATEYVFKMVYSLASNHDRLLSVKDFRFYSLKGLWLASWVAGELKLQLAPNASQGQHHINEPLITVWLTRNVGEDDLMGYLLENMYFGSQAYGLNNAAKHYFGKTEDQLTTEEIISLVSLLKSPSRYNPIRNPKRFAKRVEYFVEGLKENWPEEYGDYQFSLPQFINND